MSVREAVIEFPEKGVVLVQGLNLVSKGKLQSIGSGKTALGEALSRTLLGVKGRYTQIGRYSHRSQGNTLVTVTCEHKGKPLVVDLGVKAAELNKTGEALRFTYDGQQVWRDRIGNTRDDLTKLLTVPPNLAEWTVYLDGDKLKFDSLSHQSSVELLMSALAQPPWTEFLKSANLTVTNMKRDLATARNGHQNLQAKVLEIEIEIEASKSSLSEAKSVYENLLAENTGRLAAVNEELATKNTALNSHNVRMAELKKEIKRRTSINAEKCHALEIERNRCIDELNELKDELSDLTVKQSEAASACSQATNARIKLTSEPKNCPTCGKPWKAKHSQASIAEAKQAEASLLTAYNAASVRMNDKQSQVSAAKIVATEVNEKLQAARNEAPITPLSKEYETLEGKNSLISSRIANLQQQATQLAKGPDRSGIVRAETLLTERERNHTKAKEAVETSAAKMVDDEEALRIAEYWQEGFGPGGIPNMILKDAIGPLNETSRRISSLMTGNCIQIGYETSRELGTGAEKAELNITVDNPSGAEHADGGSKGESSLTNLIVAETLAEVGGVAGRIGYRWYDEISSNADEVCRRSIFAYLKELANRCGILVFVVDHSPEAASFADYVLLAEKTAEGTVYRWD